MRAETDSQEYLDDRRVGLVPRPAAEVGPNSGHGQLAARPDPVSQSSYLNERDRFYRAAETVENGGDLAERSVSRLLRLDKRLRAAELEGVSPRVLAIIEKTELIYGHAAGALVNEFMNNPYERW